MPPSRSRSLDPLPSPRSAGSARSADAHLARVRAIAVIGALLLAGASLLGTAPMVRAVGPNDPVLAGSLQAELGCDDDWIADCEATKLAPTGDEGVYASTFEVPAGQWELKVAVGGSWDESYGLDGGEDNIPLAVAAPTKVTFRFDAATHRLSVALADASGDYTDADADLAEEPYRHPGDGQVFYFVLTDRFENGDTSNDEGGLEGDKHSTGYDPTDKGFYQGGDLAGLRSQLDYIEGLGVSAIWLTPSFTNKPVQGEGENASAGYHGYWITDFTTIDPHLGTNQELKDLIDDAHSRGIKVYFDIITNHTADLIDYEEGTYSYVDQATSPYLDANGDPVDVTALAQSSDFPELDAATSFPYTPVRSEENTVMVPGVLNDVTLYHNRGNSTWTGESVTFGDFDGLDDLMTEDPVVLETMEDIYTTWMDFGIDGFRIDTVKHADFSFWQHFTQTLVDHQAATPAGEDFFTFGEVYDADAELLSPYVRDTEMDSVLDFAFQAAATNWAKGYTAQGLASLYADDDLYTTASSSSADLPTFLGNHDMGRIGYLLKDSDRVDERTALANETMLLTRGQPVIYYGDEQGFAGDGVDKDARQSMFASQVGSYLDDTLVDGSAYGSGDHFDEEAALYTLISELASLRTSTPALSTGAQIELYAEDGAGIYAFSRVDRDEKIEHLVALNNASAEKTVTLTTLTPGATYTTLYGTDQTVTADADGSVTLTVPALSAVVLVADQQVAAAGDAQSISLGLADGAEVSGTAPITADVADDRWAETTFSYRLAGDPTWTSLGTAEDDSPRVFHDVSDLPTGALVEYRAVSTDAAGNHVAASATAVVGADLSAAGSSDDGSGSEGEGAFVTLPGSHNAAMGCSGDWDPSCTAAALSLDADSGLYTGTFSIPAGSYEYKVAVGGSWDENYGAGGVPGGDNITYTSEGGDVTFWYDPTTHVVASSADGPFVTLPGSFNAALGCPEDWMPSCMRSWMQDADGDGIYTFTTDAIPSGSYETKVVHGGSWSENYGIDGAPDGANYSFSTQAGEVVTFSYDISTHVLTIESEDPLTAGEGKQLAHFVDADTIAWPDYLASEGADAKSFQLWSAPTGGLGIADGAITGGQQLGTLSLRDGSLTDEELTNRAHLASFLALDLEGVTDAELEEALRGELMVAQIAEDGTIEAFTGLQIPGVLDALYANAAEGAALGPVFGEDGSVTLSLWAPTATTVTLQLFDGVGAVTSDADRTASELSAELAAATPTEVVMERGEDGVWTASGPADWEDLAYRYAVEVYVPSTGAVETNLVTDPYSTGLTLNSTHSVLLDLDDPRWAPEIWSGTAAPVVEQFADQTIYELHVRDFSAGDEALSEDLRGTYAAFGAEDSAGTDRLQELSDAGITTVHLLPTFDIATIEEDRAEQAVPDIPSDAGPASTEQQAAVSAVADQDAYNWGYDPLHYMTPEGSYATEGNQVGGDRTSEFRSMVGNLHDMGLQVVLDQVYNHTAASGQDEDSVLDRIVPGYYQRLSLQGTVETSTCCSNVATENAMAQKLMVDSTVLWARQYHVDGFRFDLMGHSSVENMLAVRAALDELTLENDGVDGSAIYLYGEGWNFGEVADNARFTQATQGQLGGTSIGAFNDRQRDAVHGGSPFDTDKRTNQGFGNGSSTMPNGHSEASEEEQYRTLLHQTDLIRLGLAGNLADYELLASDGEITRGDALDYNGAPAGFATRPEESVNYVDAHDNEALYDVNVWKLPEDASMETRVRMNNLSLATVTLGQSPSFWAGGTDLLRSKSMDRDSYNSGDHFNTIDWSETTNGFGNGLPVEEKNGEAWDLITPMLEDESLTPSAEDIALSSDVSLDLLRLRSSSNLFTLGDADLITQKVTFPNAGADATAGLLVMRIDDTVGEDADSALDGIVVVFNASGEPITEAIDGMEGLDYELSPIQADGSDEVVKGSTWDASTGTATVPAATVAVFVAPQAGGGDDGEEPGDGTGTEEPGDGTGTEEPGDGTPTEEPGDGNGSEQPGDGTSSEQPGDGTTTEQPGDGTTTDGTAGSDGDAGSDGTTDGDASAEVGQEDGGPLARTGLDLLPVVGMSAAAIALGVGLVARARSLRAAKSEGGDDDG
ncbi:pullulanase-type alpha-1,6-glucosidase [Brachybacterium sp. J153]|uniref:pullulanase-type alpha-1,6-glucosidase n=1 Tax=Brachybacterium sp. J153 TaxID=3116488 RepID=UPI002E794E9A|nr:pullulanase-type alpha-1,6-glucosidase [Brachybacterium sp. J153]MEE1619368.1 pullulanase-type alpha-1,6-glucosidase [Brachybacterium sp. J153]